MYVLILMKFHIFKIHEVLLPLYLYKFKIVESKKFIHSLFACEM